MNNQEKTTVEKAADGADSAINFLSGNDPDYKYQDMITNVLHAAERADIDLIIMIQNAVAMFDAEKQEPFDHGTPVPSNLFHRLFV